VKFFQWASLNSLPFTRTKLKLWTLHCRTYPLET
jgi:hypothetical protein